MSIETAPTLTAPQPTHEYVVDSREAALRTLLGPDYEYAHDSGLVDMFYHNPETGEDGLIHTLAGEYAPGTTIPQGFHHGPSGEALWPSVVNESGVEEPVTRRLESRKQIYPMEPLASEVVIGGLKKTALQRNSKTGEMVMGSTTSSMYPDEYDALAVTQAIRIARENPVHPDAPIPPEDGRPGYVFEGLAPLIDGKSHMTIRMVVDRQTDKIRTAFPKTPRSKPIMGLSEEQMWQHIMTPGVIEENKL